MGSEAQAEEFGRMLANDDAHAARVEFVRQTCASIEHLASSLDMRSFLLGDPSARALGLATQMAGKLASGACDLLDSDNAYAAAALIRQVVEIEYLMFSFADCPDDIVRWLKATPKEHGARFRPAAMRQRSEGRFAHSEYHTHCDIGGHPNPRGWYLLENIGRNQPFDVPRSLWADLAQHLHHLWSLMIRACEASGWEDAIVLRLDDVARVRATWLARDPAARHRKRVSAG